MNCIEPHYFIYHHLTLHIGGCKMHAVKPWHLMGGRSLSCDYLYQWIVEVNNVKFGI